MMGSSLCWADSSGVADDPSLRTWTNKNTGSTVGSPSSSPEYEDRQIGDDG